MSDIFVPLSTAQAALSAIGSAHDELDTAYDALDLAIRNARLAPLGLAVGDQLFFTDEYRALTGLDKVPGASSFLNKTERLFDWHEDHQYLSLGYEFRGVWTQTSGIPNIPLDVVKRMKAESARRRGEIETIPAIPLSPLEDAVSALLETLFIFPVNDPFPVWVYTIGDRNPVNGEAAALVQTIRDLVETARLKADGVEQSPWTGLLAHVFVLSPPASAPAPDLQAIRARLLEVQSLQQQIDETHRSPIMDYVGAEADRAEEARKLQARLHPLRAFYAQDVGALLALMTSGAAP